MIFVCPHCHARCRVSLEKAPVAGQQGRCPQCKTAFDLSEAMMEKGHSVQILVVDDSPFFREMIVDMLQPLNARCLMAGDASAAWDLLQQNPFDLLIVDINLPGENGASFIRRLRAHTGFADLPVLAMSSVYRREQDVETVMRAGATSFINKSFRPEELCQRVESLLNA